MTTLRNLALWVTVLSVLATLLLAACAGWANAQKPPDKPLNDRCALVASWCVIVGFAGALGAVLFGLLALGSGG